MYSFRQATDIGTRVAADTPGPFRASGASGNGSEFDARADVPPTSAPIVAASERTGNQPTVPDWLFTAFAPHLAALLQRIDILLSDPTRRIVLFVGATPGAGTSTLATAYAHAATKWRERRVLLLSTEDSVDRPGVLECIADGLPVEQACRAVDEQLSRGALLDSNDASKSSLRSALSNPATWHSIGQGFDEVVLDCRYSRTSPLACLLAPHVSGVVLVVEADRTPKTTAMAVCAELNSIGANVLGTILNKRLNIAHR